MHIGSVHIRVRNIPVIYAINLLCGLLFFLPILALYYEKELYSTTNVAIIFAVEAIAGVLFEMPTGAIADLFGRKNTIILDHITMLCALVVLWIGGSMAMFILYAVLSALSRSLASGTYHALLYDSLQEEHEERHYKKIVGVYDALWPAGASAGSIIGGFLATYSLQLTVTATFLPVALALILSFFIREPVYEKENHTNIVRHVLNTSATIARNAQLMILISTFFVMLALGESVHLMSPLFFAAKALPVASFGWISALIFGFSSLGFYCSHDISERIGNKTTLILATTMSPLFILTATLLSGIPLVVFWTSASIFYGIKNPIINHLLNAEVSSGKRATVISINNFAGQLGVALVVPFFGHFAELYSMQTAVQLSTVLVLIVPVMLLFIRDHQ